MSQQYGELRFVGTVEQKLSHFLKLPFGNRRAGPIGSRISRTPGYGACGDTINAICLGILKDTARVACRGSAAPPTSGRLTALVLETLARWIGRRGGLTIRRA